MAATVYIDNAPIAGTNITLTNAYSLWIANGQALIDSAISSTSQTTGTLIVSGGVGIGGTVSCDSTYQVSGTTIGTVLSNQSSWLTIQGNSTSWLDTSFSILVDFDGNSGVRAAIQYSNNSVGTSTNAVWIGSMSNSDFKLGTNDSTRMIILGGTNAGRVGIGTTPPAAQLEVSGSVSSTIDAGGSGVAYFLKSGGLVSTTGPLSSINVSFKSSNAVLAGAGFYTTPDARLKKDFNELDDSIADAMLRVKPLLFRYKNDDDKVPLQLGYKAQDLLHVGLPHCINFTPNENMHIEGPQLDTEGIQYSVDYSKMVCLLHKLFFHQQKQIEELLSKAELTKKLTKLT